MNKLTLARAASGLAVIGVESLIMEKARAFTREKKHVKGWATVAVGLAVGITGFCLIDEASEVYLDKQLKAKQEIEAPALIEA